MKAIVVILAALLCACASAPQPYCIPPELTQAPESSGPLGAVVPRAGAGSDEYARCKEREADARLDAQLREDDARARQREAERLERELRETGSD